LKIATATATATAITALVVAGLLISGSPASASFTPAPLAPDNILPIKSVTPGAINPDVTQANIQNTICVANWTATIRPSSYFTTTLKKKQLANEYLALTQNFGTATSSYEEDHLISLEIGGSPADPRNLWPQPYAGTNARKKDAVETALKRLVCNKTIKLATAQKAIATNWVTAYNKYVTSADIRNVSANG
jgi:hypothetical protein